MKDKNIVQLEKGLCNFFNRRGWMAFKGVPFGSQTVENSYVVALKNGRVTVLSIQQLPSGNSKKKVSEEVLEMEKIKQTAVPTTMGETMDITTGFAIAKGWSDVWYYADTDRKTVKYSESFTPLDEVVSL